MPDRVRSELGWLLTVVVLVAPACSRANPLYDGESDGRHPRPTGGDEETTSSGPGGESESTMGGSGQGEGSATSGSTGGIPSCEPHDYAPATIDVLDTLFGPLSPPIEPGCNAGFSDFGVFQVVGSTLELVLCKGCGCEGEPDFIIELGGSAHFPPDLFGCGEVFVWEGDLHGQGCDWEGLMVFEDFEPGPTLVVSNTLDAPYGPFDAPSLVPETMGTCGDAVCDGEAPGRYELLFGDVPLAVGEGDFADLGEGSVYFVSNEMSSLTEGCDEWITWTAER